MIYYCNTCILAPNSYNIPTKVETPLYTISGRHKEPIDERLKVPAPGTYDPEKGYKFILTYSPEHTFGIKIQTNKFADTPGEFSNRDGKVKNKITSMVVQLIKII